MAIERGLASLVVRDLGVNYHILPPSIFEELEDSEPILNAIIDDEVLQKVRMSG